MDEITARDAWTELEAQTDGEVSALAVIEYLAGHTDGWVAQFCRMAYLVAIAHNW